jgi:aspergillopepsin I
LQAVGAATGVADRFWSQGNDGILGMGFGAANTVKPVKQRTFFDNVKGLLRQPVFTAWLQRGVTGVAGAYDFGWIDERKYIVRHSLHFPFLAPAQCILRQRCKLTSGGQAPLKYLPVDTTRGYWEVRSTAYTVGNGTRVPLSTRAIVDTGSTLLVLPAQTVSDFYAKVKSARADATQGGYVYDCGETLPDLTLEAAGPSAPSSASGTAPAPATATATLVLPGEVLSRGRSTSPGSALCYGGVQAVSAAAGPAGMVIWGDVLLKALFVVFDGSAAPAGPRIGFAEQAPPGAGGVGVPGAGP